MKADFGGWWGGGGGGGGEDCLTIYYKHFHCSCINKDLWYVRALSDCYSPKYMYDFFVFLFYILKNLVQVSDLKMPYFVT